MPRFSEIERERIQKSLLVEGEKLFTAYGMKKVTIDDIVKAVHIAKATFYRFYEGKEYLYMDIVQAQQTEIYEKLAVILKANQSQADKVRVKNIFFEMFHMMSEYPMLQRIDRETINIIARKVSEERLAGYLEQGFDAVKTMEASGIHFRYEANVISQVFHTLYDAWISLQAQPEAMQKAVIDIMLDGIIDQIL